MFTDSYLLSVTLQWLEYTANSCYMLRTDSADTSTFVTGKSATETEMRPEENSHAWGSWKTRPRTTAKLSAQFICKSSWERFRTTGMIIICVQNTSLDWPPRIYERNSVGTWNSHRLWTNPLMFWSKRCCWYKKTWHWALLLHQF